MIRRWLLPLALHAYRFSCAEYYAIAGSLDPTLRYELLTGTIYAMSPAKPPHAGIVDYFLNRLRALDLTIYQLRSPMPQTASKTLVPASYAVFERSNSVRVAA